MIQTGFESRIKVQDLIESQLPSFILDESPNAVEFLKQYYISQEYQGGPIDIADNLDQYLKLDNLTPEVVVDSTTLTSDIDENSIDISVSSTKGFPDRYGLLRIDDEIITYTGKTTTSFTGCVRGFSGITNYQQDLRKSELIFEETVADSHTEDTSIQNLSSLFLKDFYKKLKYTFAPGFENITLVDEIDAGNFIKRARDFYASKGTDESIRILFNVVFGETPKVINLEDYLLKSSSANYIRREIVLAEVISGNIKNIVGQTLFKSSDQNTNAPISNIESFSVKGKTYHKLEIFIGFDDRSLIEGTFSITPNTKVLENVLVGDNVISVDSTISFPESGELISGNNTISYTSKSINQFFGCSGIDETINATDNIRTNDTYFSYENGDITKRVELILFGIIDDLSQDKPGTGIYEGDIVTVKNFGDKIENTSRNYKEIFANSWIYNTRVRYTIDSVSKKLGSPIDRSSLKIGDFVEVLDRGTENVLSSNDVYISDINLNQNTVTVENFTFDSNILYDIRRKLNKSSSSGPSFEYGDSSILSDVLNLYSDNDDYAYVASNSLPSKTSNVVGFVNEYRLDIDENIRSVGISSTSNFGDYDAEKEVYNSILLASVPFITGDRVYYSSLEDSIGGLESGQSYYVEVLGSKIKLYYTLGLLEVGNNIEITPPTPVGSHTFVLYSQKDSILGSQKLLKKFPLDKNIEKGTGSETTPGAIGMLINGVEINNYKSNDSIYYGPLSDVNVIYGGEDYDVINPPKVEPNIGTAKIQPVISGVFETVYVDTQDYDIDKIVSINIDGGNGSGAVIEPVLSKRSRVVLFDAKESTNGGGINTITDRIVFSEEHNFINGEEVFYNSLGNESLVDLATGSSYFVEVNNNFTVTLYNSLRDQQSQSNPITFSSGSGGTQQFITAKRKNQVSYIQILEKGSGYTNRKLIVNPSGISTTKNTINFTNHGFDSGEIIEYSFETAGISGISTTNQYYVLKNDNNSFRLCNAGIGGTITENYERKNYIKFDSSGSGYQYFKYPDISVSIKYSPVGFGTTTQEYKNLITTPVVKGNIIDSYLYDGGSDYGSTLLNYEKKPIISIKNGKSASLNPVIVNGSINRVNIGYGGIEYFSIPDLEVIDSSGSGTGAQLRSTIENGKIVSVEVVNPGIGYSSNSTSIKVIPSGKNANINPQVRKLTVNDSFERFNSGKVLLSGNDKLQYSVSKYFTELRESFLDTDSSSQSKIIGWAYDGNPIYGPYGISDPNDLSSEIKKLYSGYDIDISNVTNRPSGFASGYFVEDYVFNNSGDLDEHNGRYEKNEDFPNGIYAYHATLDNSIIPQPEFPYFVGNSYNSKPILDDLDQSYNFNDSTLLRNTLPYKVSENNAEYNFFDEVNDTLDQRIEIESISTGSIDSINILNPGNNYKVGDILSFDKNGTSGQGLNANVSSIKGKEITEVNASSTSYLNSIFTWKNSDEVKISILPNHSFSSGDYIAISGFSTSLSKLNGFYRIQVPSYANGRCLSTITSASVGDTGEIYISPIPENISIGSSITIGAETLKILGIFRNENILRIERGSTGVSHTVGTAATFLPDSFTISESIDKFDSSVNDKVFFNPRESVGVSTISGVGYSTSFVFGNISNVTRSIPAKSIHIENHPFTTNQPVIYTPNGSTLGVSTDGINQFNLPSNLFIVNKQPNLIGIKTQINGSELFFHNNGDDDDQYLFESNYTQILGDVQKDQITVSVSTSHSLQVGDTVKLNVEPNLSVGIGTSTAVRVLYKSEIDAIVVNPIGFNSTRINTTTNEITITDHGLETGDKVYYEDDTFEYLIDTNDQIDTTSQGSTAESIFFKPDGTKMYVVSRSADEVNEYDLSTPWSPSTATFANVIDVTTEVTNPSGIYIRDDGLKFWVCGFTNDRIYQYSMSTAWDISTASYDNVSLYVGSGNSLGFVQLNPEGIYFKYDGTVLYIIGRNGASIHQLDLSTPWDITTAFYSGDSTGRLDIIFPPYSNPYDIHINSSGTILYWVGSSVQLYIFKLSTPWDITTGVEIDRFTFINPILSGVYVSPDEENFYIVSAADDIVKRYRRPSPLTQSEYYIFKVNKNKINLCETYIDSQQNPPTIVSFASTGGSSQTLSLINPEINPIENNNLVFDLSDTSLSGYNLKFYCENDFKNEFVSVATTSGFTISGVGTVGVSSTASLTLEYNSILPDDLYYTLEKTGSLSGYDNTVHNYSKISYEGSGYNGSYSISGIGTITFTINSNKTPEKLSYSPLECDTLEYTTTSTNAEGPVDKIDILSSGFGYKKLPTLESTDSVNGKDLFAIPQSKTIGKEKTIRVINDRFTYSSDKTLSPKATLPYFIITTDSNTIESVDVTESGEGYTSSPDIILVNTDTREVINSGLFKVNLQGQSISSVDIVSEPKGLPNNTVEIFATNNSNGISILEVESSNTGIFTCLISTPPLGFSTFIPYPFSIGEKVFIEGIQKISTDGSGFNSEDYGYKLFTISGIDKNLIPNKITIDVSDLTTNTGIAKTEQDLSGTIINESDYPSLTANQKISQFQIGEKVSVNGTSTELKVVESIGNNLRLMGNYTLSANDVIIGNESGSIATINYIENNSGVYKIDYSNTKNIGWSDNIGKLNEDYQVTPNNDYYQNLSYSIKSSITYKDQQSPVENLVHTSGLKNFADTELLKSSGIGSVSVNNSSDVLYSISDEKRVDSINSFDHVYDIDVLNSRSKYLKFQNKRLTDYTELKTLNALRIDDISDKFSNFESQNTLFLNIEEVDDKTFYNYLIRVTNLDNTQIQFTDITILSNGIDSYIIENESITNNGFGELHENGEQYGSFELYTNAFEENFLRFVPVDPYDTEYDLKIIRQVFEQTSSGVGTTSLGFVNLTGKENIESTGIGTTSIIQVNSSDFNSLYITSQVINTETDDIDYVKLYVIHDGSNTYMSEYYIDTDFGKLTGFNNNQIGSFYSDLDGGVLSVYHENDTNDSVKIRSNIVGFGNTTVGVGTFRYILDGQIEGTERSAIYESNYYSTVSAASTVIQTLDVSIFNSSKCIVEVSAGSTKALHQVMMICDQNDVYTQQLPFLSVSGIGTFDDASGIGTFGGEISGSDILLSFYPDPDQTGEINIEVFSKSLYTDLDAINEPESLDYGIISESIDEKFYNAINGDRINRVNFGLFDNNTPIFTKVFNPNSVSLAQTTGIFTIKDHFFSNNEELIYTPSSSFIGIAASAMKYTATDELPSQVFAIKLSEDTFQISTTRSGTAVTFTSLGSGNQHQFTMSERNTKTLITIDDLVQYPIAPTKITHNLTGNVGGGISETTEIISLSGISTINPKDILRIDDEYMGVINVGLGTTNIGPIINEGTENLVQVDRGFVGSSATSHTDSTLVRVYKGAYNIIDNEIYFAEAPRGNPQIDKTDLNLEFETSTFTGRVFLRSDYTGNQIYDNISDEFTGIGRTFTLKVGGANTTGLGTDGGSGLVFINSIYQSPKTDNNPNIFNYEIEENTVAGVTTLTFSGITKPNIDPLEYVTSDYDINLNETPRGGIIISYGSTPGLGFAPLVGASVTAVVSGGVITSVGLGTTDNVGSGYNGLVSIGVSVYEEGHTGSIASIDATVGIGGTLSFTINDGGTGYTNPQIFVSDPSYENLPVIGVSRLGIGATTDTGIGLLVDLEVGASTGIGSTLFEVKNFKFSRSGYSFQRGDVFKPVGLVTDASLSSPLSDFTITVVDTFSDSFAAWEFGELDYIDSVENLQDGERRIFPLRYNSELLSFEPESGSAVENNLNNLLIIFINGILQDPGVSYNFSGGTSFSFTTAPKPEDNIEIYFYKGALGDTEIFDDINTTLEIGDTVQVLKNNDYTTTLTQDERFVYNLSFSDKFETNPYTGVGINEDPDKVQPLTWTKKKRGSIINGEYVSKIRDSIEALVLPTARVIKDFTSTDTEIFVENAELFQYEDNFGFTNPSTPFNALLINGISTTVTGSVEKVNNFTNVTGFSGFITGIATAPGIGTDLALQFNIIRKNEINGSLQNIEPELKVGYPIYIYDTRIGSGVTSIDDSDSSVVGIGTVFLDNIYYISSISSVGEAGIITCNVKSDSNIIGLSTTGISSSPVGQFSWGRLSNSLSLERLNPISIGVSGNIVSGLSTYPTIQRRGGVNLRQTGALPKVVF